MRTAISPVFHIADGTGVFQHRRHVGGDEIAPLPIADDQGAVLSSGDQSIGIVGADDAQGVGPLDPAQAAAHGLQHVVALIVMEFQQLGHHLRIRVGLEGDALLEQVLLELHIVFNDAVVDQGDLPIGADVGVGVDVAGLAVGGPAGVSDAQRTLQIGAAVNHV